MSKEIKYKDEFITVLPSGWYEYYSDKQGRFLKFDTLTGAKRSIDKENYQQLESTQANTIKITERRLSEIIRESVKRIIRKQN